MAGEKSLHRVMGAWSRGQTLVHRNFRRNRAIGLAVAAATAGLASLASTSHADVFQNTGGTAGLDLASSWFNQTTATPAVAPPGSVDIARWDNLSAGGAAALNTPTSWLGIVVVDPAAAVTIGGGADVANTLTIGASGIDMSAATQNLTISNPVILGAAQSWNVATGRTLTDSTTLNLGANALTVQGAGNTTVSGVVSGAGGSLVMNGTGTLTLSAANTFTGGVTINSGTVAAAVATAMGPAANTVTFGGGTWSLTGANATVYQTRISVPTGQSGTISITGTKTLGPGTGNINGGGTLNLVIPSGAILSSTGRLDWQNFTGTVSLGTSAGDFRFVASSTNLFDMSKLNLDLGSSTGRLTQSRGGNVSIGSLSGGASTQLLGPDTTNAATPITIGGGSLTSTTFSGVIKDGTAPGGPPMVSLIFLSGNSTTLAGTNLYTGTTNINSGATLTVGGTAGRLGSGALTNNGSLVYNPSVGASLISTNASSGAGTLTHSGAGTTTFSGNNAFSGGTTINAGLLQADNATSALGTGAVTVNSGGALGGRGLITAAVTTNSGAILAPGDAGIDNGGGIGVGTLSSSTLSIGSGSILNFDFSTGSNDSLAVTTPGGLTIAGGGINLIKAGTAATPFKTNGVYNIFSVSGGYGGSVVGLLPVLNAQGGVSYDWGTSGDFVTLTISGGVSTSVWASTTGGSWNTGPWNGGVPNAIAGTATFGSNPPGITSPSTISLDGSKTIGALVFNNTNSYTISQGSGGSLTLDNTPDPATITVTAGSHTISAPVVLAGNATFSVNSAPDTFTVSGVVSGTGNLSTSGAGTVVLSNDNTYVGNTTINAGNLQVGAGGTTGTLGTGNVTNNATLTFNRSNALTLPTIISGTGAVVKAGGGTLTLTGANTYTGGTTVSGGTLQLGTATTIGTSPLTVGAGAVFDVNGFSPTISTLSGAGTVDNISAGGAVILSVGSGNATTTFTGVIANTTGTVALTKVGNLQLRLGGANTYTGDTTVSAGSLRILAGGSLNSTGTIRLNVNSATQNLQLGNGVTISNPIIVNVGSNEAFDVIEAGNATLSGNITTASTGAQLRLATTVAGANLTLTGAVNAGSSFILLNRGSLTLSGSAALSNTAANGLLVARAGALTLLVKDTATITSPNWDTGNNQAGAGALTMTVQDNASVNIAGSFELDNINNTSSSYADYFINNNATLAVGSFLKTKADLAHPVTLNFDGSTLAANTSSVNFLPLLSGLDFNIGANGLKLDDKAHNITISHNLQGSGSLTKLGTGVVILAGSNSYGGDTIVNAGVLDFTTTSAFGGTTSIRAAANSAVGLDTSSLDASFLGKLTSAPSASVGALALSSVDAAANLDFTTGTLSDSHIVGMSVGALPGGVSYTGTITPAASTYRLGGPGGTLTLPNTNALTGSNAVVVTNGGAVVLSGANDYTGTTSVNSGSLTIDAAGSIVSTSITVASGATMNVNGSLASGATVNANGVVNFGGSTTAAVLNRPLAALNVGSGVTAKITPSAFPFTPAVLHPTSLSFAGGTAKIDITNNELITTGTLASIVPLITTSGQIFSTATGGGLGTLQLGPEVEVRFTLLGDTNLDGKVDVTDLGNLASNYGATSGATWVQGDTNYSGAVDVTDLGNLASNYGGQLASGPSAGGDAMVAASLASVASGAGAAVPEPTTLGLLAVGTIGLLGRRSRRQK